MKRWFPDMIEAPDDRAVTSGVPYWVFAFFLLPLLINLSTITSRGQDYEIWFEIGYHVINFVFVLIVFLPSLRDAFLMVQANTKSFLRTVFACAGVIVVIKMVAYFVALFDGNMPWTNTIWGCLLTNESDLLYYSTAVVHEQPLWGTLCMVVLAPITVSCLLYGAVFAPICVRKPWLAYVVMTVAILAVRLNMAFCLWPLQEEMMIFVVLLPAHLIGCWAYQKTDTIWAPITIHFLSNLLLALMQLGIMSTF